MTNKSGEKECGCPECTAARGETPAPVTAVERARITMEEFAPLMEQHGKLTSEILSVLAKMNGHKTMEMGQDFAMALLSALMAFVDTASKPNTPVEAKLRLLDLFVSYGRNEIAKIETAQDNEMDAQVKAFADMLGVDLKNVTVLKL